MDKMPHGLISNSERSMNIVKEAISLFSPFFSGVQSTSLHFF